MIEKRVSDFGKYLVSWFRQVRFLIFKNENVAQAYTNFIFLSFLNRSVIESWNKPKNTLFR